MYQKQEGKNSGHNGLDEWFSMKDNFYSKILNWVLPIFVVFTILTGGVIEGLVILIAYLVYRFYSERDKYFSFFGKNNYLKGNLSKAVRYYEKAYKTKKAEAKVVVSYAYALILQGDFNKSDEILAELRGREDAQSVFTQLALCDAVLMWKRDKKLTNAISSLEHFDDTLRTSSYYGILGKMLLETGNIKKARDFNEDAYRYNSKSPDILENLIRVYCIEEEYERAAKAAEVLLKKKPRSLDACYYCAVAFEKTGKVDKARSLYKKALKFDEMLISTVSHDMVNQKK